MKIGDCSDFPIPVFKEKQPMNSEDFFPYELLETPEETLIKKLNKLNPAPQKKEKN